ncbi:hypothetical protein J2Z69_001808 [Paenibacillus shirakamiensis]|uniref:Uncharacterized protein n=1 Tax=Paenibacillus shirakamiensis TaxID=1265935 RepID=A0ABS4JGE5_9BACL|nr:hypothetical protein [Paenibacillus shirakamiensis]MBP2000777.1 hypothetical protein [Paenibacillus shirakamiensis]
MINSMDTRMFKFWHYSISHGELLIRSIKSDEYDKNIDIMFFDVVYVELPRNLANIRIIGAKDDDVQYVNRRINKLVKPENIIVLLSNEIRYVVVASIMKVVENDLEMFELPFNK